MKISQTELNLEFRSPRNIKEALNLPPALQRDDELQENRVLSCRRDLLTVINLLHDYFLALVNCYIWKRYSVFTCRIKAGYCRRKA